MKSCFDPVLCNVTEMDESYAGSCFDFQHIKIDFILPLSFARDMISKMYVCVYAYLLPKILYSTETPMKLYRAFLGKF